MKAIIDEEVYTYGARRVPGGEYGEGVEEYDDLTYTSPVI